MSLILNAIYEHAPHKTALIGDKGPISYGQLADNVEAKAKKLTGAKALGIALENGTDWVVWDLAAIKAGVACVPLPGFFSDQQRNFVTLTAGISHIVTESGLLCTGAMPLSAIPKDTAKVTFTSGTTGTPKGVCLTQEGIERTVQSLVDTLGAAPAENHLSVLPLSILLENIAGVYATLLAGGTAHIYSPARIGMDTPFAPDLVQLAHMMSTLKTSAVILVPELLRGLIQVVAHTKLELPALQFAAVGGAKVSPELILTARALGLPVYEGYGLSECASVIALNVPGRDAPGTVGHVLPHVDVSLKDGEVVINNPAFLGYLGQPHHGAFHTGDLGRFDDQGHLCIEGRKKNILITSHGRNIAPEWVESTLLCQPGIMQAVVYGDAKPHLGALIVPAHENVDITMALKHANESLPSYSHIKEVHTVRPFNAEDGTLTATGRPRRETIFKKYATLIKKESLYELLQPAC